ncbi:glycerophosphodiester phosphodiesterase family protein [Novosphingobium lentum]|uniref:glycerophosphodiester phosphodiesterase family protein n=1 Tax=Novosphingobium lentum TaxID=145287 RepID=UPI000836087C|nr:glycerophosphodiester phosphodiesterase family protein [Novosphingobium lentum]
MADRGVSRRDVIGGAAALAAVPLAGPVRAGASVRTVPLVLGHRGACAHRPEHTLASYARAIADGADFVEPDLVATRDGVLVARHENNIAETTDVATHAEFATRKATRSIDGETVTGWFTEDFTLAELKTLRAKERLGAFRPESQAYDGEFQIVTFAEMIDFVAAEAATRGRSIGIIPELKHSTYFAGIGLPLEQRFVDELAMHSYLGRAPVIVQSFEIANLLWLRTRLAGRNNVRLMQLTENGAIPADRAAAGDNRTWRQRLTPAGIDEIARYADFIAPNFRDLVPQAADGKLGSPTPLPSQAHRSGLLVGTWTFRPENRYLAADFRDAAGDTARNPAGSVAEIRHYLAAGVDAFFTDDPALGRLAVDP